ncbi:MAG: hypothetical protein JW700_01570 [Candidatus Aenigmarchaeota archaeon]|nr:hypothetical protein [Candidatus Aenigmarchaeota archaeon]
MKTLFYKINIKKPEESSIVGDMISYAGEKNIGLVGQGIESLCFKDEKAVYFSFNPGQIYHSSITEKSDEDIVEEFEIKLNESNLEWKRFDLGKLLENV